MSDLTVSKPSAGHFILRGELNRNTVPFAWKSAIADLGASQSASPKSNPIVDFAEVEDVDTTGLAWLINLLRQARLHNIPLDLQNVPPTLVNLAKISDVDNFLSVQ